MSSLAPRQSYGSSTREGANIPYPWVVSVLDVWDHVRWREPIREVADPWITLTAIATATEGVMLGPLVTPLARRRPAKSQGRPLRWTDSAVAA